MPTKFELGRKFGLVFVGIVIGVLGFVVVDVAAFVHKFYYWEPLNPSARTQKQFEKHFPSSYRSEEVSHLVYVNLDTNEKIIKGAYVNPKWSDESGYQRLNENWGIITETYRGQIYQYVVNRGSDEWFAVPGNRKRAIDRAKMNFNLRKPLLD